MRRSIFKRYLGITMAIVTLSFLLLGGIMMGTSSSNRKRENREQLRGELSACVQAVSDYMYQQNSRTGDTAFLDDRPRINGFLDGLAADSGTEIFVADRAGAIIWRDSLQSDGAGLSTLPADLMELAKNGPYEGESEAFAPEGERRHVMAAPVWGRDGIVDGAAFVVARPEIVRGFRGEDLRTLVLASLLSLGVTFALVALFAYRQVRPLQQMSAAAKALGRGNFSVRVPVTGEDELGELAASFNSMADSLSLSEGTRRSFIANVSHELKTPMTTIAGFIDGILDGTIPQGEQKKYLSVVSSEVKRLSRLVRSMLDLSRIDNGELRLSPVSFDLAQVVVTTFLTFEQSIDEKHIEVRGLEEARPLPVYGDEDLLHQVVYNLVENAVKFTNEGGAITVTLGDSIDRSTVVIENTGDGIAAEELPHIFERFYKTDKSRSLDKKGMGLGLYIVKTILTLHGGDIAAASVPGEYCRFEFYIPKSSRGGKSKERAGREHRAKASAAARKEQDK